MINLNDDDWHDDADYRKLAGFLGGQGFRTKRCRTRNALLQLAVSVFGLPEGTNSAAAVSAIVSLRVSGRKARALVAFRSGVATSNKKLERQERKRRKNKSRAVAQGKWWAKNKVDKNSVKGATSGTQKGIGEFYSSWEWKRLRYDFLKQKDRRCGCCGSTPADGARMVVDHVKPIRHFWHLRLDASNLQILCNDCNMGKGSRDQTYWNAPESALSTMSDELGNIVPFPNVEGR